MRKQEDNMISNRYGSEFGGVAAMFTGIADAENRRENRKMSESMREKAFIDRMTQAKADSASRAELKRAEMGLAQSKLAREIFESDREFGLDEMYKTAGAGKLNSETALNDQAQLLNHNTVLSALAGDAAGAAAYRAGTKHGGNTGEIASTLAALNPDAYDEEALMRLAAMDRNVGTDSAFSMQHQDALRAEDTAKDYLLKQSGVSAPKTVNGSTVNTLSDLMMQLIDQGQGNSEDISALLAQNPRAMMAASEAYQQSGNAALAAQEGLAAVFGGTPTFEGGGWFDGKARLETGQAEDVQRLMANPSREAAMEFIEKYGADAYEELRARM